MIIAVDAMGGDNAPEAIVKGSVMAAKAFTDTLIVLVGDKKQIKEFLPRKCPDNILVYHTTETIGMAEKVDAVRTKRHSSLVLTATMAGKGIDKTLDNDLSFPLPMKANGMVGLGNSAATMSAATLKFGRIENIDRPAIASRLSENNILLDAGATTDCSPRNLEQFAIMGIAYAKRILRIEQPTVGLLAIGGEKGKGNKPVNEAYEIFEEKFSEYFIGNVEGRDLLKKKADVTVTDGFAGNIALKSMQGVISYLKHIFKSNLLLLFLAIIPIVMLLPLYFLFLRKKLDYKEYGGAPLLGLNGVCIIGHGSSDARATKNAIRAARKAVENNLVETIKAEVEQYYKACT